MLDKDNGDGDVARKKFRLQRKIHGDLRLTRADICVAFWIIEYYNPARGCAWPSQEKLAELVGLSSKTKKLAHAVKTVSRSVARLVQFGIVRVRTSGRRGHATEYVPYWEYGGNGAPETESEYPDTGVADTENTRTAVSEYPDTRVQNTRTPTPAHPLPSRSDSVGMVRTDAGRSPPDGARARAGKAESDLFKRLWALPWPNKSLNARRCLKRAVTAIETGADAPSSDLVVAKAESYLASTPRGKQRWAHVWLEGVGWDCDEPRPKPAEPERASKAKKAERASKAKKKPYQPAELAFHAAELAFPPGMRVWDREGHAGEVMHAMDDDDGRRLVAVAWRGAAVGVHRAGELLREKPL
jgi:hypothetical protein